MVDEFSRRREFIVKRLREIPHVNVAAPSGAFYAFPDFSVYTNDDKALAKNLIKHAHVVDGARLWIRGARQGTP